MNGPGAIPMTEIVAYLGHVTGLSGEDLEDEVSLIRVMDAAWLDEWHKKNPDK